MLGRCVLQELYLVRESAKGREEVLMPRRRARASVPYLTLAGFQYLGGN